jgi:hypothetical protein
MTIGITNEEGPDQEYWRKLLGEATMNSVLEKMVGLRTSFPTF